MDIAERVKKFYEGYRGRKEIVGKSAEGREIYAFFVGSPEGKIGISQYAMHAREWIVSLLALDHIARGVKKGGVWFVPLVNPDGALRVQRGDGLWKANAEGVDLNVNFPARWGKGAGNRTEAGPEGYIGKFPLSAPESRSLANFTLRVRPAYTVSWHTKGEEIYWRFRQPLLRAKRDKKYAEVLSKSTGYPLAETPLSAGGYKDWCVETLKIPAFTVEAGRDSASHPLGEEELGDILKKCGEAVSDLGAAFGGE